MVGPRQGIGAATASALPDAIVDAALEILDADGVDALTIRRLGQELGTGAASLYWHVASKDELCERVYDRIMGEIELPEPDPAHWEDQLKDLARQAYRVMLSHNDAVRLSIGRPPAGANTLPDRGVDAGGDARRRHRRSAGRAVRQHPRPLSRRVGPGGIHEHPRPRRCR